MRIFNWNCNGAFRNKVDLVLSSDSDIYVIQESENPIKFHELFGGKVGVYSWSGDKRGNKGLLLFSPHKEMIQSNDWEGVKHGIYQSFKIDGKFDLIAVWAKKPYIEGYYDYQQMNIDRYNTQTVVVGDFNSNSIWDGLHGTKNHTEVVRQLKMVGLESAYHIVNHEPQGKETNHTFYFHRNPSNGYHIDYCFIDPERLKSFLICDKGEWLQHSDHLPMIVEL